jgi:HAD superfamily hydrolase (TIGR01509 family)
MSIKSILFDLDGVLIDTEGIYSDFWNSINDRFPTGVEDFAQAIKGNTLTNILNIYFPNKNDQLVIRQLLAEHEKAMPYRAFKGALNLLTELKENGIKVAVVTSSNRDKMRHLFQQIPELEGSIDTLITDEDVSASKPDPQGYLTAAARLGSKPAECVVVEDSLAGLEAGRRAGAKVVAIATTNPRSKVENLAQLTVDTVANLDTLSLQALAN